jgi:hypothetical protein
MLKRSMLPVALVAALSLTATAGAQAALSGQTLDVVAAPTKQDKKKRGGGSITVTIDTQYSFPTPAGQTAQTTFVEFDRDFVFNPGKKATCNPTALVGTTTEIAKSVCGPAAIGYGFATLCSFGVGCAGGGQVGADVTGFNGPRQNGQPTVLLHTKTRTAAPPSILNGVLGNSPLGGPYGKRLTVAVPDTSPTGLTLTHFRLFVPKQVTKKKRVVNKKKRNKCKRISNKKKRNTCLKKAKKTVKTFYVSQRCSNDRRWSFTESTAFRSGGGTLSASTSQACVQKPNKKKKKKKKKGKK